MEGGRCLGTRYFLSENSLRADGVLRDRLVRVSFPVSSLGRFVGRAPELVSVTVDH